MRSLSVFSTPSMAERMEETSPSDSSGLISFISGLFSPMCAASVAASSEPLVPILRCNSCSRSPS